MNILIIGGDGQLGHELIAQSRLHAFTITAPTELQLNITDRGQVQKTIEAHQPALVINAAAYTNVDKAETDRALAFAVNKTGPANLAQTCDAYRIPLVQISTDYVFDGKQAAAYRETDAVSPLGVYGQSKAAGEQEVRASLREHIILRTSWLYGVHGQNFVKTMLTLAMQKDVMRVVADQYGSPTSATDLAEAIMTIADRLRIGAGIDWGTYHYCGEGITTWHAFAEKIIEIARPLTAIKVGRIERIKTADYPTKARRPAFSALDCRRIGEHFGIASKPWQQSLKSTIERLFSAAERFC